MLTFRQLNKLVASDRSGRQETTIRFWSSIGLQQQQHQWPFSSEKEDQFKVYQMLELSAANVHFLWSASQEETMAVCVLEHNAPSSTEDKQSAH